MDYGLCYVALPEKEQCGTRLTGYAADKALLHFIVWEERMTCPWYLCQAVGTEMPLVTPQWQQTSGKMSCKSSCRGLKCKRCIGVRARKGSCRRS